MTELDFLTLLTEADEAAESKAQALDNLRHQVEEDETQAVIAMYERAAWGRGATPQETDNLIKIAGWERDRRRRAALPGAGL